VAVDELEEEQLATPSLMIALQREARPELWEDSEAQILYRRHTKFTVKRRVVLYFVFGSLYHSVTSQGIDARERGVS